MPRVPTILVVEDDPGTRDMMETWPQRPQGQSGTSLAERSLEED
jgi:hypothetical protein